MAAAAYRAGKRSRAAGEIEDDDDDIPALVRAPGRYDDGDFTIVSGGRKQPRMSEPTPGSKATVVSDAEDTQPEMADEDDDVSHMEVDPSVDTRMSGQVRRVLMTNLRCHRNFELNFTPHSNFIAGRNGSGKSSVLTAIRLALGWEPDKGVHHVTGKATNGYETIIRGRVPVPGGGAVLDMASPPTTVEVDFTNVGVDSVSPDKFGAVVRIKRIMKLNAAGRIKNEYEVYNVTRMGPERVPGDGKEHMATLRDGWGISPKNPVMIMDQETSKKFLAGNTREQYKFFMDATLLSKGYEANVQLTEQLAEMKMHLATKKEEIAKLREEERTKLQAYQRIEEVLKLQSKIKDAQDDVVWAHAHDAERAALAKVEAAQADVDTSTQQEGKLALLQGMLDQRAANVEQAQQQLTAALAAIEERRKEVEELTGEVAQESKAFAKLKLGAESAKKEVKAAQIAVVKAEASLQAVMDERKARNFNSARDAWQREIDTTQEAFVAAQADVDRLRAQEPSAAELAAALSAMQDAEAEVNGLKEQLENVEDSIETLTAGAKEAEPWDVIAKTSRLTDLVRVRNLYTQLHRDGKITSPPLDPLGMYVRAEPAWKRAVECAVGLRATTIVFTNQQDAATFESAARAARLRPQYLARGPTKSRYATPPPVTEAGRLRRLMEVMDVEDDSAFNALMDDMGLPHIRIADSVEEFVAKGTERRGDGMFAMRDGAKSAILRDGRTATAKGSGPTFRRAEEAIAGIIRAKRAGDALPELKAEKAALTRELRVAQAKLDDATKRHKALSAALATHKTRLAASLGALKHAKLRADKAASVPEPEQPDDMEDAQLESNARAAIAEAEGVLAAAEEKAAAAAAAVVGPKKRLEEMTQRLKQVQDEVDNDEQVQSAEAAHKAAVAEHRGFSKRRQDALQKYDERKTEVVKKLQAAQAELDAARAQVEATAASTGMPAARDPELTEAKASAIVKGAKAALAKQGQGHDDAAVKKIAHAYEVIKAAVQVEVEKIKQIEDNYAKLTAERKSRQRQWKKNRMRLGKLASSCFVRLMKRKGFKARLEIDHDEGESNSVRDTGNIRVLVAPDHDARHGVGFTQHAQDDASESTTLQEVGTLSGGEKSLATLMLMAAFAKVCTVPFRIIDEFDVYQDEANRKFSMETLIEQAGTLDHEGRKPQYLLLTPHDISQAIVGKPDVSVYRLADPVREADA